MAASAVEGRNIGQISIPDGFALRLFEEPRPNHDVVAVSAQRMWRTQAIERQIEEKTIEIGIV
jgi:hypothetical protein